jgi:hypothetical protein
MASTTLDLQSDLELDFDRVCAELVEARLHQQQKDTPANRAAVVSCWARIDRVLDLYLDMSRAPLA